jgi:hypothetical protein
MHLIVYRKDASRLNRTPKLPSMRRFATPRRNARDNILNLFEAIHPQFKEGFVPPQGGEPWIDLLPMRDDNIVVLDQCLHRTSPKSRFTMLDRSVESLDIGGSLIIIDEWSAPKGCRHPISKRKLDTMYMDLLSNRLILGGGIRLPIVNEFDTGMYGYQYLKVA